MTLRAYAWTNKQVENYKELKKKEEFLMLGDVSKSVQKAMESLGSELEEYLKEARGEREKKEDEEPPKESLMARFLGDFYTPKQIKNAGGKNKSKKELKEEEIKLEAALKKAKLTAFGACWGAFHFYKKAHGMVAW